jgi:hypothetical protein
MSDSKSALRQVAIARWMVKRVLRLCEHFFAFLTRRLLSAITTEGLAYVYYEEEPQRRSSTKFTHARRGAKDRVKYRQAAGAVGI